MPTDRGEVRVPEIEERLDVRKREVQQGEVRVHKRVETEEQSIPVDVMHEEVEVEQRTVTPRPLAEADSIRAFEEGTIRIPIRGEEVVVRKEAVVTGEVVINKERTMERQEITETVRKQHVEVDRDYERHRNDFRSHFDTLRADASSEGWDDSEGNYRYGWAAGRAARYAGKSFEDVEGDLRTTYYADTEDARWQRLREQVREGFRRARSY
ncbi:MAG TPA: YsnF/AvaK domain-containing protein [Chloroflexota bacterium]|nr:YsnF/AvaK domain-containing protein [Chloroflexota bacterium]